VRRSNRAGRAGWVGETEGRIQKGVPAFKQACRIPPQAGVQHPKAGVHECLNIQTGVPHRAGAAAAAGAVLVPAAVGHVRVVARRPPLPRPHSNIQTGVRHSSRRATLQPSNRLAHWRAAPPRRQAAFKQACSIQTSVQHRGQACRVQTGVLAGVPHSNRRARRRAAFQHARRIQTGVQHLPRRQAVPPVQRRRPVPPRRRRRGGGAVGVGVGVFRVGVFRVGRVVGVFGGG
jgi:ferric-dicitrate binding protein FerR (iron transport regulator)